MKTTVDISLEGGLGDVTEKNTLILNDTFTDFLTAVRHGNGRDWWIMVHKDRSNRSYCFLLDPGGLHAPVVQQLGPVWDYRYWAGQSVFSPDGRWYARANPYNGLQIYPFDRCSGQLSKPLTINLAADSAFACGVAFSSGSRFLYLSTGIKYYQFDMQAPDIAASKTLVGEYDWFASPFATTFYQQRLAPDGKIYMSATNGVNVLHVTNNPDAPGQGCNFVQHGVQLPTYIQTALVNYPYYRLYDLAGSPCDTLGVNGQPYVDVPRPAITPNPASDQVSVQFGGAFEGDVALYDAVGRVCRRVALSGEMAVVLPLGDLAPGVYYIQTQERGGQAWVERLSVWR